MPIKKKPKKKRDYKKEYKDFHGKPKQIKQRDARNAARNRAEKEGKVKKGDALFEICAENEKKLDDALSLAERHPPISIESMLLGKVTRQPK